VGGRGGGDGGNVGIGGGARGCNLVCGSGGGGAGLFLIDRFSSIGGADGITTFDTTFGIELLNESFFYYQNSS
jgi:hypothetical protein